jgi:L-fuculose-phosphate aldolase
MKQVDLSHQRVLSARDVESAGKSGATEILVNGAGVVTPSARDVMGRYGIKLIMNGHNGAAPAAVQGTYGAVATVAASKHAENKWEALLNSPEARKIKEEICHVGHKLWARAYVDGNGGNISYRITEDAVICTPTLMSKGDLKPEDLCLVDLDGNQLAGKRPRTSDRVRYYRPCSSFGDHPRVRRVRGCRGDVAV